MFLIIPIFKINHHSKIMSPINAVKYYCSNQRNQKQGPEESTARVVSTTLINHNNLIPIAPIPSIIYYYFLSTSPSIVLHNNHLILSTPSIVNNNFFSATKRTIKLLNDNCVTTSIVAVAVHNMFKLL